MKAYELLARLRCLVLAGCEEGELWWIGTKQDWTAVELEEQRIIGGKNVF